MQNTFEAYNGPDPYIFVSYCRADSEDVYAELEQLHKEGVNIWFDSGIKPGHVWTEELAKALKNSSCFVYFITPQSVVSKYCLDELQFARTNDINVLAIHLVETALPDSLEFSLGRYQAILRYQLTENKYREQCLTAIRNGLSNYPVTILPDILTRRLNLQSRKFAKKAGIYLGAMMVLIVIAIVEIFPESNPFNSLSTPTNDVSVRDKSIAILPFVNLSSDPAAVEYSLGIHDDLLMHVSKISSIRSISRTSIMRYADSEKSLTEIANELAVSSVMEGSIQLSGDRLRMNVSLFDANSEEEIWTDSYDYELDLINIFAVQTQISKAVADSLQATLTPNELFLIEKTLTENSEAYESYLLAKLRKSRFTNESLLEAIDLFENAITLDPDFALAYLGLADSYQLLPETSGIPESEILERVSQLIDKALELDPLSGEAYASQGGLKDMLGDYEGAERAYTEALRLNPNYVTTYDWYGYLLRKMGRLEEALDIDRRGMLLDPYSIEINIELGWSLIDLGRYEEAMQHFDRMIVFFPDNPAGYGGKATVEYQFNGRIDRALVQYSKSQQLDPSNPRIYASLSLLYRELMEDEQSSCYAQRAIGIDSSSYWSNYANAMNHIYLNQPEQALGYISYLYENSPSGFSPLLLLRNRELELGDAESARMRYINAYPELMQATPNIDRENFGVAISLAFLLAQSGEHLQAEKLLSGVQILDRRIPVLGWLSNNYDNWLVDVRVQAVLGNPTRAINSLRRAIDDGWRTSWQYYFDIEPEFASLRELPEFQQLRELVQQDLNNQREAVLDAADVARCSVTLN
ncbi:MAG: TIR domain-containing protein [Proteobacteria bacterium]|nr:TIR domain-containing protein [Pseudomonadota bacterium]